ncbi:hypothetical protein MMC19_005795 [Ptychographa xylographoides]|nr:hypothetical protein [Ptychographa xylographoides]
MAPLQFNDISLDIKRLIISFIDRPTDLKNLCLSNKELQAISTPILYKTIHLFVGGIQDLRLSAFLGRDNPGIPHIREIFLRLEKAVLQDKHSHYHSDDSSDEEDIEESASIPARQAQFTVRLLLDHLPRDTLQIFSWQNWEPLSVDNFILLCKKQHKLRVIEIGPMDTALTPILQKNLGIFENLKELNSIDMYPDSVDRLKASQILLQAKPEIAHLCVSNGFEYSNEVPEDLHDSSTRHGLLSRTLFSHMQPFETCKPYCLSSLDLDTVELRYAADTWLKVIKFSLLEKLEIRNCAGADVLFAQLSKPHLRPAKLRSIRWMDDEKSEHHALEAFEGLLESLSGLETIHVYINRMRALPKIGPIVQHRKTLTSLSIHSQINKDSVMTYSEEDYSRICNDCSNLRQLSVMFPKTSVELPLPTSEFSAFITCTLKLRHLMTLNIRRWPSTRDSFTGTYTRLIPALRMYEHQLQRMTQRIFELSDTDAKEHSYGLGNRSRLSVLSWGGNGKTRHDTNDKFKLKQIPFIRGWKVDPFGERSMLAVQTIWRLVQFVEPESDILNRMLVMSDGDSLFQNGS